MIFKASRSILFLIVLVFSLYKSKRNKKWVSFLFCFFCTIIVALSSIWPVENLFVDFKTPEKALTYYAAGEFINGEITDIEDGEQTCMVLYEESPNSYKQFIFPKTEKGYKLPYFYGEKIVVQRTDGKGFYTVHNYEGSNDYYLFAAFTTNEESIIITDSCGKQIDPIVKEIPRSDLKSVLVLSIIDEFTDDYAITINEKTIKLNPNEEAIISEPNTELKPALD